MDSISAILNDYEALLEEFGLASSLPDSTIAVDVGNDEFKFDPTNTIITDIFRCYNRMIDLKTEALSAEARFFPKSSRFKHMMANMRFHPCANLTFSLEQDEDSWTITPKNLGVYLDYSLQQRSEESVLEVFLKSNYGKLPVASSVETASHYILIKDHSRAIKSKKIGLANAHCVVARTLIMENDEGST